MINNQDTHSHGRRDSSWRSRGRAERRRRRFNTYLVHGAEDPIEFWFDLRAVAPQ